MAVERERVQSRPAIQVLLDGQLVRLPGRVLKSLAAVRAQLELMALRQERVLAALSVDGEAVSLPLAAAWSKDFRQVQAQTVSLVDLGRHMAAIARKQVDGLEARADSAAAVVLINEWASVSPLLDEFDADLQSVLLVISFLHELCGRRLAEMQLGGRNFPGHLDRLSAIRVALERARRRHDLWAISDILNQQLAVWLRGLGRYLARLSEAE